MFFLLDIGPVQTNPDKFENGITAPKTDQMFSVYTNPSKCDKKARIRNAKWFYTPSFVLLKLEQSENTGNVFSLLDIGQVQTNPDKFENGILAPKTDEMFSV